GYGEVLFQMARKSDGESCPYDVSPFSGIRLWVKGNVAVRICVPTTETTSSSQQDCHGVDVQLEDEWTEIKLPFDSIEQEGWGDAVSFDERSVLGVTVRLPVGESFEVAIDDVEFY